MKPAITIEDALGEIKEMFINQIFTSKKTHYKHGDILAYSFPNGKSFIKVREMPSMTSDTHHYFIGIDDYYMKYKADRKHIRNILNSFSLDIQNLEMKAPHLIGFARIGQKGFVYKFDNNYIPVKQTYRNCVFTNFAEKLIGDCRWEFENCHFQDDVQWF